MCTALQNCCGPWSRGLVTSRSLAERAADPRGAMQTIASQSRSRERLFSGLLGWQEV